jgi:hypothetical protein
MSTPIGKQAVVVGGFLTYARRLRTPTVYNAIKDAKRVGEIVRFGFPASVWRHFERLETFPRPPLPFADAVCRFNPVYGQGMSVAAQEACLLHRLLGTRGLERDPLAGLAPAFFVGAQALIDGPWAMAAIPALHKLIAEVQHFLKPRTVYRDPELVQRGLTVMTEA